jgi:hypothetical protein
VYSDLFRTFPYLLLLYLLFTGPHVWDEVVLLLGRKRVRMHQSATIRRRRMDGVFCEHAIFPRYVIFSEARSIPKGGSNFSGCAKIEGGGPTVVLVPLHFPHSGKVDGVPSKTPLFVPPSVNHPKASQSPAIACELLV